MRFVLIAYLSTKPYQSWSKSLFKLKFRHPTPQTTAGLFTLYVQFV